jgi:hypothetical protein
MVIEKVTAFALDVLNASKKFCGTVKHKIAMLAQTIMTKILFIGLVYCFDKCFYDGVELYYKYKISGH